MTDNADYEEDVPEALVSATCQTSTSPSGWDKKDQELFVNQFLHDHLIELRQYLMYSKCGLEEKGMTHSAVPSNYPPVPKGDKILYAKKKSPIMRVLDSGYNDMNDMYSNSNSNSNNTSGHSNNNISGSGSGTGSGSSSGNGLSTVGAKEEQKLHLTMSPSLSRQRPQSVVPLTLQPTAYGYPPTHPPAHTHTHTHTYTHGTDSGHASPTHSPGIQGQDQFTEPSHGELTTPEAVPHHRGSARSLMRRLAPSRENSKGTGLGLGLGLGLEIGRAHV